MLVNLGGIQRVGRETITLLTSRISGQRGKFSNSRVPCHAKFLILHVIILISTVKRNAGIQADGDLCTLALKLFDNIKMF